MFNDKEENALVQVLITHIISLNEVIDELEEEIEITKTVLREQKQKINAIYGKEEK